MTPTATPRLWAHCGHTSRQTKGEHGHGRPRRNTRSPGETSLTSMDANRAKTHGMEEVSGSIPLCSTPNPQVSGHFSGPRLVHSPDWGTPGAHARLPYGLP